jgi:hypothetical protein
MAAVATQTALATARQVQLIYGLRNGLARDYDGSRHSWTRSVVGASEFVYWLDGYSNYNM